MELIPKRKLSANPPIRKSRSLMIKLSQHYRPRHASGGIRPFILELDEEAYQAFQDYLNNPEVNQRIQQLRKNHIKAKRK
ncbi:hypothetical protein [Brevibacillus dissolubilis]|uniref:hypothetical protein n=1 Tax=Brevibacillus dissolubilis TaxID=1844116 RepID=UPI0011178DB5|nr:hypothetical protein [Brevibacillus dissolubilis]